MTARIATTMCGLLGALPALAQTPLGTALTYQGRLYNSGVPANGLHDMQFQLFTALSGGSPVGSTICRDGVNVVDGLFTVSLDFGAAYDGNQRFLAIGVRPDSTAGNCASGGYTALSPRQALTAAPYALKVPGISGNSLNAADGSPANALFVDNNGLVGIGTTAPQANLHVVTAGEALRVQGSSSSVGNTAWAAFTNSAGTRIGYVGDGSTGDNDIFLDADLGNVVLNTQAGRSLVVNSAGNVGIGTTTPTQRLHVSGGAIMAANAGDQADMLWLASERSWVFRQQDTGAVTALKLQSIGGGGNKNFVIQTDGFVGIGTLTPAAKLDVAGTTRTQILEIAGADIAEKFPASEKLEPGMVVAIDADNAGHLCLARGAYNPSVAGVVSGANDFKVGAVLGNLPGHEDAPPIALSGRVYVWCDASTAAIEPGNLLTTSDTPGHAMKATDRERSHGAVIGKAMTGLACGERGMVLVLVNLQ